MDAPPPQTRSSVTVTCRPAEGPEERWGVLVPDRPWVWGRGTPAPGTKVRRGWNPPGLSRQALVIVHSTSNGAEALRLWSTQGRVVDTTSQTRSNGGVDVYDHAGVLRHRLGGASPVRLMLGPGRYRAVVRILDEVCEVDIDYTVPARPASRAPGPSTSPVWDLTTLLPSPCDRADGPFAVALIAAAVIGRPDLRGDQPASKIFEEAVEAVLGRRSSWAYERLNERKERRRIDVPPGGDVLHYVAQHMLGHIEPAQVDEVAGWVRGLRPSYSA